MEEYKEYLEFAKQIAYEAKRIMLKYFESDNESKYKGDRTIVTKADTEINSYLIKRVKEVYPTHMVDGEEEKFGKSDYVWVCDPVDGTAMYARHIPVAVFSLALVIDGEPKIGVIYDPFTDNLYSAIKGSGAYQNDKKIGVNDYELSDERSVANFDMWNAAEYNIFRAVEEISKMSYIVEIGSVIRAAICVATGEFSALVFPGTKHKNCDIAAAKVIVEEAGGIVTDLFGNDQRYDKDIKGAIIANKKVHSQIVEIVRKYI